MLSVNLNCCQTMLNAQSNMGQWHVELNKHHVFVICLLDLGNCDAIHYVETRLHLHLRLKLLLECQFHLLSQQRQHLSQFKSQHQFEDHRHEPCDLTVATLITAFQSYFRNRFKVYIPNKSSKIIAMNHEPAPIPNEFARIGARAGFS